METLKLFTLIWADHLVRIALFSGGIYYYFWRWRITQTKHLRIQRMEPTSADAWRELRQSLVSSVIFATLLTLVMRDLEYSGTRIYWSWRDYGLTWFLLSLPTLVILHDTYFYWMHRSIHHPKLYNWIHSLHHESRNPTPFAVYSFQATEAVLESLWIIPVLIFLPIHIGILVLYTMITFGVNAMAHSGVEVFPNWCRQHWLLKYLNYSTYHNDHHRRGRGNYSFYFSWWDRVMGTLKE